MIASRFRSTIDVTAAAEEASRGGEWAPHFNTQIYQGDWSGIPLRAAKGYTSHLHLADNTRMEPGTGDIDFVAAFKALVENGFTGYMAYECGITGDSPEEKAENLAKSLDYMRDCVAKAKA